MNPQADHFFDTAQKWKEEYLLLREIILENKSLEEDFKWMHPCYVFKGRNVVLIHGFKDYCALLFHKGALMQDPQNILIQQTENVQAARQVRFSNSEQILQLKSTIRDYVKEAIATEKSGKKVELKKVSDYPMPEEFRETLDEDAAFKDAFYSLTPGRQKGYLFYFNQAKLSATRVSRINKYYDRILAGKGIDDK
jgi:uncharacterized protein YdeI (YjbR/CyaY-like superfamily)